jgi:UDP:flavonoid glycosyltransferase YjiC (YdhE family)
VIPSKNSEEKPLIGFFPPCHSLADTGRLVMIAKRYNDLGGKSVFFSHGGKYEYIPEENGFDVIRVDPILEEEEIEKFWELLRNSNIRNLLKMKIFNREWLEENVENEIYAFNKTKINMLVSAYIYSCSISTRVSKIPHISILNDMGYFNLRAPDVFENFITRLIPQSFKVRFLNWYASRTKLFLRVPNKVAKKYKVSPFKYTRNIFFGDYSFETNAIEFINVFSNPLNFPSESYIGPILLDELFNNNHSQEDIKQNENEIKSFLNNNGKSIFINLGSVGHEKLFLKIIKILNGKKYNVVALYNKPLKKEELSKLDGNILIKKVIPSIEKVHKMVDLSIIHGGQGTVYAAAYSGKPIIGFPVHGEQVRNIEKLVGHGSGLILSIKYFKKEQFLEAINKIFSKYDSYLANAQKLAKKLPSPKGAKNAVRRIIEIQNNHIKQ